MKKIRLKLEENQRLLTKNEMKKIHGGYSCCICYPGQLIRQPYGKSCYEVGCNDAAGNC